MISCPICLSRDGFLCNKWDTTTLDGDRFDCEVCGSFVFSRSALASSYEDFSTPLRAILSRRIRLQTDSARPKDEVPVVGTFDIEQLIKERPSLPSPAQQAANIIRYIGDYVTESVQPLQKFPPTFHAIVGAPDRKSADKIAKELATRGVVTATDVSDLKNPHSLIQIDLSLAGWEIFEAEKRGITKSKSGFVALKFGDETLDRLLNEFVKPSLNEIGHPLIDLRDVSRAGVIDNILRAQIQDAAFVLADLTHDNAGAYWEAGYAEGLGKPVIYICEKAKFDEHQTHFDTNHSTTVMWSSDDPETFVRKLAATIRRSLDYK